MQANRKCNLTSLPIVGIAVLLCVAVLSSAAPAQRQGRSSLVEDRAAKKLLEAGDARYESNEVTQAVEVWQSVIERYPRSRVRFEAHMRLGDYYLERERAYERARVQFESVIADENPDGLEWSLEKHGQEDSGPVVVNDSAVVGAVDELQSEYSALPDYSIDSEDAGKGWTSFAAVVGSVLTMALVWIVGMIIKKRDGGCHASRAH